MKTKSFLTASDVRKIIDASEKFAAGNDWHVTISVVDDGGQLLGLLRMDGAAPLSATISPGKAHAAALGRCESGVFEERVNGGRTAFLSVPLPTMLEGGVPIIVDGHVIGAVGVSGVKSTQDVEICKAGIAALGIA
ncbi:MAG: heme-binding protein [Alcaligenaceae bacterium]|nr:heme-binding protein [Alcaligenaceae bacterium]